MFFGRGVRQTECGSASRARGSPANGSTSALRQPRELAVVDPLALQELELILDARVDGHERHAALLAVVGCRLVVEPRPVRQPAPDDAVRAHERVA